MQNALKIVDASVKPVFIEQASMPTALKQGNIDVLIASPPVADIAVKDGGVLWISGPKGDLPDTVQPPMTTAAAAMQSFIDKNPEAVQKFVAALQEAAAYIESNPTESGALVQKRFPELDPDLFTASWEANRTAFGQLGLSAEMLDRQRKELSPRTSRPRRCRPSTCRASSPRTRRKRPDMTWIATRPDCAVHFDEDCHTDPWGPSPETVVLIHGTAESAAAWTAWLPRLTRHFRVIRVDLPGFGRSLVDVDAYPWSMASLAEDVLRVLDGLGESKAHVVGAKAGGAVALSLACAAPDRLHSVVALTGPMWATGPDTVVHQKGIGGRVEEVGVRDWAAATMPARLGSGVPAEQIRWWVDLMARTRPEALAATARGGTTLDLRPLLHRIKAPALMVTSAGSPLSASDVRDVWHEALPHGRSVVFPDDGYHIAAIQPDACRIVSAFLRGDDRGYQAAVAAHDGLDVRG